MSYQCTRCGQTHDNLPDLSADRPAYAQQIPDDERDERVRLNADLCVIDGEHYFIRGVIEIPVAEHDETFGIGAWVTQKPENFQTYLEHFDSHAIGPFFGWLANDFLFAGERTLNLKTLAYFRGNGARPLIELEESDHPLAIAQREGMSLDQVWDFVHQYAG